MQALTLKAGIAYKWRCDTSQGLWFKTIKITTKYRAVNFLKLHLWCLIKFLYSVPTWNVLFERHQISEKATKFLYYLLFANCFWWVIFGLRVPCLSLKYQIYPFKEKIQLITSAPTIIFLFRYIGPEMGHMQKMFK